MQGRKESLLDEILPSQWVPHGSIPAIWNATELKWLLEQAMDAAIDKEKNQRGLPQKIELRQALSAAY
jgi:hypothetical protein